MCACCAGNGYWPPETTDPPLCEECGHPPADHDEDAGPSDTAWHRIHGD